MRQSEGGEAVADSRLGLVGQFLPAVADIDAQALETEQHGRRILHVDVDIRRSDRERRREVAEAGVVEFEHGGIVAILEREQRAVPPQMMLQVVAALPVGRECGEPLDAFAAAALRFQHVGDGVRGPQIAGVELDRAAPGGLGSERVPGLLLGEAAAAEYRWKARDVLRPGRDQALDGGDHVLRAAEPEIDEMGETECDHIMRMGAQDRLPRGDGTIELALRPSRQGCDVAALARRGAGGKRLCGVRGLHGDRNDGLLEREHREIALHAMRERELRIGLQHRVETRGRIGAEGEVAGDQMVEGSGSLGAGG